MESRVFPIDYIRSFSRLTKALIKASMLSAVGAQRGQSFQFENDCVKK